VFPAALLGYDGLQTTGVYHTLARAPVGSPSHPWGRMRATSALVRVASRRSAPAWMAATSTAWSTAPPVSAARPRGICRLLGAAAERPTVPVGELHDLGADGIGPAGLRALPTRLAIQAEGQLTRHNSAGW
jgi:hypothetical protein